ncbi:PREDICTED: uncharacterized protein LOC109193588 isoform X2 [Ipomoea nil]|uniref:uncharacterized protein LOC109193588 isoform X2 n=1 Tax=Ipomoea nil TaxID=35883 RepID=UPI00090119BC|nr:PREDICTED: uncharacterized protein LOC109193588 isoform X2 [Ipomoea nil]
MRSRMQIRALIYGAERCDICGDIGFAETIITCEKCKINQEHLYCMETFRIEQPEVWICEECTPRDGNQSSCGKNGLSEAPNFTISSKDHRENLQCAYPRKSYRGRGWVDWEKKVAKGRTKYISAEEAIVLPKLQNVASNIKITRHSNPLSPKKHVSSPLSRTPVNPGTSIPKFQQPKKHPTSLGPQHLKTQSLDISKKRPTSSSSLQHPKTQSLENSKKHPTSSGLQHPKTQSLENSNISQVTQPKEQSSKVLNGPMEKERAVETDKNIGDTKITRTIAKETTDKHTSVASACCLQVISVSDGCATTERGTSNVNLMSFSTNNEKCFSDPAQHPSWKGSFNVCDNLNFKGFQAHHPLRVRRKVCEFSKLLPEILDFKLVPRGNLWGKLFHDYCPTREDVGLYFFPSDKDRSKEYMTLLELIRDQDLMMRKQIDNVEILVLTSTVLQMECQKVEGKYFLWGLFHRIGKKDKVVNIEFVDKEVDISGKDNEEVVAMEIDMTGGGPSVGKADSINSGDDDKEVDMEIDMIGGRNVGKQDVVIRRDSSGNRYESSTPTTPVTASGVMQCGLSKVKREEPFQDWPPGFKPRNKSECSTPTAGGDVSVPPGFKPLLPRSKFECSTPTASGDVSVPPGFKPLLPRNRSECSTPTSVGDVRVPPGFKPLLPP